MSKTFQGRPVLSGQCQGEALVSHEGFNTLASFQKSAVLQSKTATCSDQNNPDIYKQLMTGKILCLPQTIGSTTGGLVIMTACNLGSQPKAMLFSDPIDSLAAAGVILSDIWLEKRIVVVDSLGEEFLETVQTGESVSISEDGKVTIE